MNQVSRRALLVALAGVGAGLAGSRQAFAFTPDTPSVRTLAMHENACGATASHKELVAEVERVLGDKYNEDEKRKVIAAMTCPICGCSLAAAL